MKRALICFTRPPVPGRTKTRLMPLLSGDACAALHAAFLQDIAAVCGRVDADLYVAYAPEGEWGGLREIFPAAVDFFPQAGDDLGERMHRALSRVLSLGYDVCVLIGSDLPELTEAHLAAAFAALETADVTLGPTVDGGYYLVGLKKPCRALFVGQRYGHDSVYENTLAAIRASGRRFLPAPPCRDVDVPEDLYRLPGAVRPDSCTARMLKKIYRRDAAMIDERTLQAYVHSEDFLTPLQLPAGTELTFSPLGQGEYNANYSFLHPETGRRLVLRINTGSQMHLERQIEYEFSALRILHSSGRTPAPLFCDGSRRILPYGTLVMEYLPGRALRYETDLSAAAEILADIHSLPAPSGSLLLEPPHPVQSIYEECLAMAERYLTWDQAEGPVTRLLETLIEEIGRLPLAGEHGAPRCIVNTELNSSNFLINEGARSYLVDWEKPLISEAAQDLAHFLAPTTTFWKTDTILDREAVRCFLGYYRRAAEGQMDTGSLSQRLPLFLTVTCLRGVTWCAMALREYAEPGRALTNPDTLRKMRTYLSEDFLRYLLENYVRRDFLRGVQP